MLMPGERWRCVCGDAVEFLRALPDDSIDLLFTSPPYEAARTYGIGQKTSGQEWVDWMMEVFKAAAPKVKGLIAMNCEGQTRNYSYSGVPFLLFADLKRAGFNMRKPVVFHRVGIPGSGGPDWLRNDWEPVICVTRGKLPWSENTACGHPPKWAPGGEMSYRTIDGERVNVPVKTMGEMMKERGFNRRAPDGTREKIGQTKSKRPSRVEGRKVMTIERDGMHSQKSTLYYEPAIVNPGNVLSINVGGGVMGHDLAHENEAPFPLDLAAFFVKSFCPPTGVVADVFSGSGTVCHAAVENGRRFIGCDVRQSQVDLCKRRMRSVTPSFAEACA